MASQEPIRGYLTLRIDTHKRGETTRSMMTSIQVAIPESYDYGAAKLLAVETIITELERYGLQEALAGLDLRDPKYD